ncbi:hypothetical protein CEXT_466961 [Caerostris extrusa]|uniref:Uncharacterized protein n=1 Tax=Caerostris extrusa TaxID=172846 RepID=A0AAV4U8J5_CAEEX|nr:hypothetical protein CEXT_466961 [Caerostris extrusa]
MWNRRETFHPWGEPGVIFTIHSPFVAVNPFLKGNVLRPGSSYNIHVRLEEEHLLPHPYKTNCTDYESLWKSNNRTGPRSQQMCKENCMIYFSMTCYRCPYELIMYENPEDRCNKSSDLYCDRMEQMLEELEECRDNCKPDCVKHMYPYTIEEHTMVKDPKASTVEISVTVDEPEVHVLSHKPQYMAWNYSVTLGLHGLLAGPLCVGPGGRSGGFAAQRYPIPEDIPSKAELERIFVADGSS